MTEKTNASFLPLYRHTDKQTRPNALPHHPFIHVRLLVKKVDKTQLCNGAETKNT